MPLPGGPTDKFGNRYESRWTVNCMIDVLDEQADATCLEPPGREGEGVEVWIHCYRKPIYDRRTSGLATGRSQKAGNGTRRHG